MDEFTLRGKRNIRTSAEVDCVAISSDRVWFLIQSLNVQHRTLKPVAFGSHYYATDLAAVL